MFSEDGRKVTLTITWVISITGPEHWQYADDDENKRRVLRDESAFNNNDNTGLSFIFLDWIKGGWGGVVEEFLREDIVGEEEHEEDINFGDSDDGEGDEMFDEDDEGLWDD